MPVKPPIPDFTHSSMLEGQHYSRPALWLTWLLGAAMCAMVVGVALPKPSGETAADQCAGYRPAGHRATLQSGSPLVRPGAFAAPYAGGDINDQCGVHGDCRTGEADFLSSPALEAPPQV